MTESRVLIVEDDSAMADTLESMVNLLGYSAIVVHTSRQALDAAMREHPDVILLDLNLPGINGFEVCLYLKREPSLASTPVIFVSAESDEATIARAKEVGGIDYLIKPIGIDDLESSMAKAMIP